MSKRAHHISPADRRLLRWLPLTMHFQNTRHQPAATFREVPQLQRMQRAGLITMAYDAKANTLLITRSAAQKQADLDLLGPLADEIAASQFLLAPPEYLRRAG